jgi:beta-glucanase (GH16 family)
MQNNSSGELVFFDDFTSEKLDRTKWNVDVTGKVFNNEQQAYIDSSETVYLKNKLDEAKGVLVIKPGFVKGYVTPQGDTFDFVSGRINTRGNFEFTYGSISARIKLPEGEGLWPAFWTVGSQRAWPISGELDIMESVGESDWISAAVHGPNYSGEAALVNKRFFNPPEKASQWHIYGMDWTPNCLHFKVDGELIYRVNRPMVEFFGPWVLDGGHHIIINLALGGRYPFKTNGIKKPYYGMSEATVHAIKSNEIEMLVDWVKVFKI